MYKKIRLLGFVFLLMTTLAEAQNINSPYSRYGLGDIVPTQNLLNRGMGGIAAAYYDFNTVNFVNPASYGRLQATTFDVAVELDMRSLRAIDPPRKFNAYNPTISYLQFGFPIKSGKWGLNLGLRPITRISYKIGRQERLPDIDSVNTLFEGTGGSYLANLGTGFTLFNDLSIGVNAGYLFGSKNFSSKRSFLNDSVFYYMSNHDTKSNYGGFSANGGIQYTLRFKNKNYLMRFGAYGNLKKTYNGTKDIVRETFQYNSSTGAPVTIDSVYTEADIEGDVITPSTLGAGVIFDKLGKFLVGVDYTKSKWSEYRYFGESDLVQDSWQLQVGGQIFPSGGKSYWSNVFYRAGFTIGKDYINVDGELPKWSASLGMGLPMRRVAYTNQFSVINILLEYGQRGNKENSIRENFFNIGLGLSLSDRWFLKRKFD